MFDDGLSKLVRLEATAMQWGIRLFEEGAGLVHMTLMIALVLERFRSVRGDVQTVYRRSAPANAANHVTLYARFFPLLLDAALLQSHDTIPVLCYGNRSREEATHTSAGSAWIPSTF